MRTDWQNLSAGHGRAWIHFGKDRRIGVEWHLLSNDWSAGLQLCAEEHELKLHLCLGLFSLYLTLGVFPGLVKACLPFEVVNSERRPGETFRWYQGREVSLRFFSGGPWWKLWTAPMDDDRSELPRWRKGHFDVVKALLGKVLYEQAEVEPEREVLVTMPEATYRTLMKREQRTWCRSRWPWWPTFKARATWDVKIPGGIPVPGKGENSWDCGEDAIFATGFAAETAEQAVAALRETVLKSRERHGGSRNWRPIGDEGAVTA